mmetsp:Transcript_34222/g.98671  ORF Transcript_34222/g.98671 Transcript_34222/m.98671 type:complete len:494 (-) Transcript_34222:81-1562(-)
MARTSRVAALLVVVFAFPWSRGGARRVLPTEHEGAGAVEHEGAERMADVLWRAAAGGGETSRPRIRASGRRVQLLDVDGLLRAAGSPLPHSADPGLRADGGDCVGLPRQLAIDLLRGRLRRVKLRPRVAPHANGPDFDDLVRRRAASLLHMASAPDSSSADEGSRVVERLLRAVAASAVRRLRHCARDATAPERVPAASSLLALRPEKSLEPRNASARAALAGSPGESAEISSQALEEGPRETASRAVDPKASSHADEAGDDEDQFSSEVLGTDSAVAETEASTVAADGRASADAPGGDPGGDLGGDLGGDPGADAPPTSAASSSTSADSGERARDPEDADAALGGNASALVPACFGNGSADDDEDVCAICFDDMEGPMKLACGHYFCRDCIQLWFRQSDECPRCRQVVYRDMRAMARNVAMKIAEGTITFSSRVLPAFALLSAGWIGRHGVFFLTNFERNENRDLLVFMCFFDATLLLVQAVVSYSVLHAVF